ncbi:MAG: carboxypeptidase-like regulatory domain-containing protein [Chitinophagales bacterium]|nr:carboxypeptidase-like regulatory domain-containing protein [Chitinophagales bacterium]
MQKIIVSLILILSISFGFTQDSTVLFMGKIVQGSKPIYNVTVNNLSKMTGTITDFSGDFKINAQPGDKFIFSSIGYKSVHYTLPDTLSTLSYRVLINMVEDTVYLKEAVVVPWPINRTMLKEAMLDRKAEKEVIAPYAGFRRIEGEPEEPAPTIMNPLSFIYNKLNKKARQERKMQKYREILKEDSYYDGYTHD